MIMAGSSIDHLGRLLAGDSRSDRLFDPSKDGVVETNSILTTRSFDGVL
jgi:hypothetical protein